MKTCTHCHIEKPFTDFSFRNKAKGSYRSWCKQCTSDVDKQLYASDETILQSKKGRMDRNREYVWRYLEEHPCVECGASDPRVLEFDHLDRTTKKHSIGNMLNCTYGLDNIKAEIAKCRVLCANCHRVHTYTQLGWRTFD